MTGYSVLKARLTQRIEGGKALSLLRDQELLQIKIRYGQMKAPSMQFTCVREGARAKHGPQCERAPANHWLRYAEKSVSSSFQLTALWKALIASCAFYKVEPEFIHVQSSSSWRYILSMARWIINCFEIMHDGFWLNCTNEHIRK